MYTITIEVPFVSGKVSSISFQFLRCKNSIKITEAQAINCGLSDFIPDVYLSNDLYYSLPVMKFYCLLDDLILSNS